MATSDGKYHSFVITEISAQSIAGDNIRIDYLSIERITVNQKRLDGRKTVKVGGFILLAVFVAGLLDFKDSPGGVIVPP